ncbi:hypothetical protein [Hymenobacter roseosalivarius]|uniref:hypothetical protein n=1 Tax=Hymenobacter roseosalivarius TaxID=89967 RepID=UPI00117B0D7E|nr:hypothetical protein [Hymenobacter roseosalivarius]
MLLACLRRFPCQKLLNDSSGVTGDWKLAAKWIGEYFFPLLADAGLHYMAWVYSPNYFSRRAINLALSFVRQPVIVVVNFEEVASAYTWLREKVRPSCITSML